MTRSVWIPSKPEPQPVWSGRGWGEPTGPVMLIDGQGTWMRPRKVATHGYGDKWIAAEAIDRLVDFFSLLSEPFVGWREHDPEKPPREGEELLFLTEAGSIFHDSDGYGPDSDGWWCGCVSKCRWRYASEILPDDEVIS